MRSRMSARTSWQIVIAGPIVVFANLDMSAAACINRRRIDAPHCRDLLRRRPRNAQRITRSSRLFAAFRRSRFAVGHEEA